MICSLRQLEVRYTAGVRGLAAAFGLLLLGAASWSPVEAAPPQPSFTLYGKAYDPFGWPYMTDHTVVIARQGEEELARFRINPDIGPMSNYLLDLPGNRAGQLFHIVIESGGYTWPIIGGDLLPPLGGPGEVARLDLLAGHDSCGDGLPDEWKWWVVHSSGGRFTDISEILPDDDIDGDDMTNWEEFLAGTDPTWDVDVLAMDGLRRKGGWIELGWWTVPGMTYRLYAITDLDAVPLQWQPASFQRSPLENSQLEFLLEAREYFSRIYVPTDNQTLMFYRLKLHR